MKNVVKIGWKYVVLFAWFLLSIVLFEHFLYKGNTDMTKEISKASLPVVSVRYDGHDLNKMFGYTEDIDFSLIRDGITPLSEDRNISFRVYKKENNISKIEYELRSVDESRFIESGEVSDLTLTTDYIDAQIAFKDLILDKTEYMLKIIISTVSGRKIDYYARIVKDDDLGFEDKVDYVYYFSECTFDKERAADELVKYLESNKSGDNTDFNHVNIHSSLDMVTWGNLETEVLSSPVCYIEEIDSKSAVMKLKYLLRAGIDDEEKLYEVEERYRFIKGSDRMYLMEFDRYMNTLILSGNDVVFKDKLMLGICSEDFEFKENESGNTYAFVYAGSLYIVNSKENSFATAYTSYDGKNYDDRSINDNHGIKILNVDDEGNAYFYVYGYFNNGNHEGKVGINLFRYNAKHNVIEEIIFIDYKKPYELLKSDVEKLAFLNNEGKFIVYADESIWMIDTETLEISILAKGVLFENLFVDEDGSMAAWPSKGEDGKVTEIAVLNAYEGKMFAIKAQNGEAVKPMGFMGEDFIYGRAKNDDISVNIFGEVLFPMYQLNIIAKSEAVMKQYEEDNIYVVDCKINDNLVTLTRMEKNDEGEWASVAPDSIVNINMEESFKNNTETVATENLKKIVQVSLANEMDKKKMKITNPKLMLTEGLNEVLIGDDDTKSFHVFKGEEKIGSYGSVSEAVIKAEEVLGVVMDCDGHYIWKKETYNKVNQIMKITGTKADDEYSSLETCIETVLEYEGYPTNVENFIKEGKDTAEILESAIPESKATRLVNVSLEVLKYYVNKDIPVIVEAGENSLLLVGYNETSTVWMNPQSGNTMKVGNDEAERFYENNGKRFLVVQTWES